MKFQGAGCRFQAVRSTLCTVRRNECVVGRMAYGVWRVAHRVLLLLFLSCDRPLPGPAAVRLEGPADGAKVSSARVSFSWRQVDVAQDYEFQVALDEGMDELVLGDTVETTSLEVVLLTDGEYFWRVRARNSEGAWGEWSSVWSVVLERFGVVGSAKTQGYALDIWVEAGRAYIADGQAGLAVFDLSNPESPRLTGVLMDSANEANGVTAAGNLALVAYGYKELLVADVSNPESLELVSELEYPQPGFGYGLAYADSMVYIAADAQFLVVDLADPSQPDLVQQFTYPRGCRGICIADGFVYLALEQLGIEVWRCDSVRTRMGSLDTPLNARDVAVAGDYAYVADGRGGLLVASIADKQNPVTVAELELPGYAARVSIADTLAYVGCGDGGLAVVNVARPESPVLAAVVGMSYARVAVQSGGYVYACDRDSGLVVIERKE